MFTVHFQVPDVKMYSVLVPYPSKTDRQTILSAALKQLARDGLRNMSLRGLAASLGVAPNALYRYFADRAALEAAMSAESARQLNYVLKRAAGHKGPVEAVRSMALAYIRFARENPHLYGLLMAPCTPSEEDAESHQDLWNFVVDQVALISTQSRAREAAVALWALLHGTVALEAAQVFGEEKPFSGFDFGLEAWLTAAANHAESKSGRRRKPAGVAKR
jgi:AcrR family transcriptional regulator